MFNFDLKKATIFRAVKWSQFFIFKFATLLRILSLSFFIFSFSAFLYGFFTDAFAQKTQSQSLGLSIIFLTLTLANWYKINFLNLKLKNLKSKIKIDEALVKPEDFNLAEFLSFEATRAIWRAIKFSERRRISQVPSQSLLYFSLEEWPRADFVFFRSLLNLKEIKKDLKNYLYNLQTEELPKAFSEDFQKVILEAAKIAQKNKRDFIKIEDIVISQSKIDPIFKKHLMAANIKTEDIENLCWWLGDLERKIKTKKRFWEWENLLKRGSLAKEWAAGFTITLDRFSTDLSDLIKKQGFPEIIGHQQEIEEMERILSGRETNNVLIVGEAGSGRKSMVQALAVKSVLGQSLPEVNFKRVVQLNILSVLSQTDTSEEAEAILDTIFREVIAAGNIILVIDEFHNFVSGITRPGVINISGVLSPYLALPQFQIIALTTFEGLHKYIEENSSVISLFEKVEVSEISERETLMLLEDLALKLESKYKKFISYQAIRDIIYLSAKYMPAIPFPEKAMDLLDEVMVYLYQIRDRILLPKHVAKIVTEKTQIPVGEIKIKEKAILLNLENLIHQRIINQEEAVKEVSAALRRARAEIQVRKGPMGCFLFLGPTGVGKTETSKALAEIYFGSEERMIRLDMSEFQAIGDIPRLIGASSQEGLLTTQVRENPFSLILLDEIEKAHPNILNLFLQVLDEGHLTDGLGRRVDFKNSIIIATSNAGYQVILEALKQKTEWPKVKEKLLDFLFEEGIYRPEFINRFDAVTVFKPLTKENLLDISELLLQKIKKNLAGKDIDFVITPALKEKIVELGYDITFGARNMQRVIQDKVGNVLAQAILSDRLKRGERIEIDPESFVLIKK